MLENLVPLLISLRGLTTSFRLMKLNKPIIDLALLMPFHCQCGEPQGN